MELIDFDAHFQRHMRKWMDENTERFKGNLDRMEEEVPEVYLTFLETPAPFLGGQSPKEYFDAIGSAGEAMTLLERYLSEKVSVPDLLLERLTELPGAEETLYDWLLRAESEEARMTAVSLLEELESTKPLQAYVDYIASIEDPDPLADHMGEALAVMGQAVTEPILARYDSATPNGREVFADILSNFPGDKRISGILLEQFRSHENKALFASYLAKYGDEAALPDLKQAAEAPELSYLDFVEISSAIEALGGEPPAQREYAGDPYYEALSRME